MMRWQAITFLAGLYEHTQSRIHGSYFGLQRIISRCRCSCLPRRYGNARKSTAPYRSCRDPSYSLRLAERKCLGCPDRTYFFEKDCGIRSDLQQGGLEAEYQQNGREDACSGERDNARGSREQQESGYFRGANRPVPFKLVTEHQ